MSKFDWDRFKDKKIAVLCKTEDEAKDFVKQAFGHGLSWLSGRSKEVTYWDGYAKEYDAKNGQLEHSFIEGYYKRNDYEIIEWSDYMRPTRKQLKGRIKKLETRLLSVEDRLSDSETKISNPYKLIAEKTPLSEEAVRDAIEKLVSGDPQLKNIEYPKDKNGEYIYLGIKLLDPDGVGMTVAFMDFGSAFSPEWKVAEDKLPVKWHKACDCTVLKEPKAPYDKNGVEIKLGDWVKPSGIGAPVKVDCVDFDGEEVPRLNTKTGATCWRPSNAWIWEIVPEPDSMERIKEDAVKSFIAYWGCSTSLCEDCPSLIDGKSPREYYKVCDCIDAKEFDLIARTEAVMKGGA